MDGVGMPGPVGRLYFEIRRLPWATLILGSIFSTAFGAAFSAMAGWVCKMPGWLIAIEFVSITVCVAAGIALFRKGDPRRLLADAKVRIRYIQRWTWSETKFWRPDWEKDTTLAQRW